MPTVVLILNSFLFSLSRVSMAAKAAAQRLAERKETMVQTCWTAMQSSSEGNRLSSVRISFVLLRPSLYLRQNKRVHHLMQGNTEINICVLTQKEMREDLSGSIVIGSHKPVMSFAHYSQKYLGQRPHF